MKYDKFTQWDKRVGYLRFGQKSIGPIWPCQYDGGVEQFYSSYLKLGGR
jgi:hypothetical protein